MTECLSPLSDPSLLESRTERFLSDRSADTLTGPRRMGRTPLVEFVAAAARRSGLRVWTEADPVDRPDLILLDHWSGIPAAEAVIGSNPDADVVFGQDLCHQVPAVVRLRRRWPAWTTLIAVRGDSVPV